jgi:competence protein ComGC
VRCGGSHQACLLVLVLVLVLVLLLLLLLLPSLLKKHCVDLHDHV